jgi:predicted O-methyltransferase YrrM
MRRTCPGDRVCARADAHVTLLPVEHDQRSTESPVQEVQRVIDRLVAEGSAVSRLDGSTHELFPVAIPPSEGGALSDWVIREGATRTIEIGLGYGVSALFVCEGLLSQSVPERRHVVIDNHQDTRFANCGLQFLEEAGVMGLVEFHSEDSRLVLPELLREGRSFDLAFIDGNHRFDGVFVDLVYIGRLVRPGGVVFIDDYHLPGIARAVSFFVSNLGWTLEEVSTAEDRHHWAVLRTSRLSDERDYDYFVEF